MTTNQEPEIVFVELDSVEDLIHFLNTGEIPGVTPEPEAPRFDETTIAGRVGATAAALRALAATIDANDPEAYRAMWEWVNDEPVFAKTLTFALRAAADALTL